MQLILQVVLKIKNRKQRNNILTTQQPDTVKIKTHSKNIPPVMLT